MTLEMTHYPLLPKPKAILFDWDNTLVDSWPVIHAALNECFEHMNHERWTLEQTKQRVQRSARDAFTDMFGDRCDEAVGYYKAAYMRLHEDEIKPFKGAEQVMNWIADKGYYCAVVSNKTGPTLRSEVESLGWNRYFSAVIGAGDAESDKPHPAHAHLALNGLDSFSSDEDINHHIWFIGDSDVDIEIADRCGFTPVFYGSKARSETLKHPHSVRIENHDQLLSLFKSVA